MGRAWWVAIALGAALVGLALWLPGYRLDRELAAARREGLWTETADVLRHTSGVPTADNAAPLIRRAISMEKATPLDDAARKLLKGTATPAEIVASEGADRRAPGDPRRVAPRLHAAPGGLRSCLAGGRGHALPRVPKPPAGREAPRGGGAPGPFARSQPRRRRPSRRSHSTGAGHLRSARQRIAREDRPARGAAAGTRPRGGGGPRTAIGRPSSLRRRTRLRARCDAQRRHGRLGATHGRQRAIPSLVSPRPYRTPPRERDAPGSGGLAGDVARTRKRHGLSHRRPRDEAMDAEDQRIGMANWSEIYSRCSVPIRTMTRTWFPLALQKYADERRKARESGP